MFLFVLSISLSAVKADLDINVNKTALNDMGNFHVNDVVEFQIIIENNGTQNITEINVTDNYNNSHLNYITSFPLNTSSNSTHIIWTNLSSFPPPLQPGNITSIFVNFTAIANGSSDNCVNVVVTDGIIIIDKPGSYQVSVGLGGGPPPGGDNWNNGLSPWRSSIVSPYLIQDEAKILNFSIYREAGEQSCLDNLTTNLSIRYYI